MKRVNNRLYNITTYGCLMLFLLFLFLSSDWVRATPVENKATSPVAAAQQLAANCVGIHVAIAKVVEEGNPLYAQAVDEGGWWMGFLIAWVGNHTIAEDLARTQTHKYLYWYHAKITSFDELMDAAQVCWESKEDFDSGE